MPIKWTGNEAIAEIRAHVRRGMDKGVLFVRGEVVKSINRGNADGTDPSKPGEPPKKVSGRLFQSIATQTEQEGGDIVGRVGTNVEYARRLELGFVGTDAAGRTIDQPPRPFLRPGLLDRHERLARIIAGG